MIPAALENAASAAVEAALALQQLDPPSQPIATGAARRLREALFAALAAAHVLELALSVQETEL